MATKQFALNTEPHVAEIGEHTFLFQPEVDAGVFLDANAEFRAAQLDIVELSRKLQAATESGDPTTADDAKAELEASRKSIAAFKDFIAEFLVLDTDRDEFMNAVLPQRVLTQLYHWLLEIYTDRPTGSANASQRPSKKAGTRSTGRSPSKG